MTISRWVLLESLLAASIGWQPASGAPINMPEGSTVWMKLESNRCPGADGNDCAGSNQAGPNPPNGIPMSTFSDANGNVTGYAEILPGTVRTFMVSRSTAFMDASFQDTYTVGGAAGGPFDISGQLHVTGFVRSEGAGSFHFINFATVEAKIGSFNPGGEGFLEESA
jgi:hypothetical protein